jgi:hypothetical protein
MAHMRKLYGLPAEYIDKQLKIADAGFILTPTDINLPTFANYKAYCG